MKSFQTHEFFRKSNEANFNEAIDFFKSMKEKADELMKENDELKKRTDDDIFAEKNAIIEELRKKVAHKEIVSCYAFSEEQLADFNKWWHAHISDPKIQEKMKKLKNSGHHATYEITPTELGYYYGIRCSCGANYGELD